MAVSMKSTYFFLARADMHPQQDAPASLVISPGLITLRIGRSLVPTSRTLAVLALVLAYGSLFFSLVELSRTGLLPQTLSQVGSLLWILWFTGLVIGEVALLELGGKWRKGPREEPTSRSFSWPSVAVNAELTKSGSVFTLLRIRTDQGEFHLRLLCRRRTVEKALELAFAVPLIFRG